MRIALKSADEAGKGAGGVGRGASAEQHMRGRSAKRVRPPLSCREVNGGRIEHPQLDASQEVLQWRMLSLKALVICAITEDVARRWDSPFLSRG